MFKDLSHILRCWGLGHQPLISAGGPSACGRSSLRRRGRGACLFCRETISEVKWWIQLCPDGHPECSSFHGCPGPLSCLLHPLSGLPGAQVQSLRTAESCTGRCRMGFLSFALIASHPLVSGRTVGRVKPIPCLWLSVSPLLP